MEQSTTAKACCRAPKPQQNSPDVDLSYLGRSVHVFEGVGIGAFAAGATVAARLAHATWEER